MAEDQTTLLAVLFSKTEVEDKKGWPICRPPGLTGSISGAMGCPVTSTADNLSIKPHGQQFFQATEKLWPDELYTACGLIPSLDNKRLKRWATKGFCKEKAGMSTCFGAFRATQAGKLKRGSHINWEFMALGKVLIYRNSQWVQATALHSPKDLTWFAVGDCLPALPFPSFSAYPGWFL